MRSGPPGPRAPLVGSERAQLAGWLDAERAGLLERLAGLDEAALRRAPMPGGPDLLGIVVHLTAVEAHWFRGVCDGQPVGPPEGGPRPAPPDAGVADVLHGYRAEVARSRMVLGRHELGRRVALEGAQASTRWVVLQVLAETARRRGQAAVLRRLLEARPAT